MHFLYILYSKQLDRYYTGHTKDIETRLAKHNSGHSAATKSGIPWQLKKVISFDSKTDAIKAENWVKRMKSRRIIEQIINDEIDLPSIIVG